MGDRIREEPLPVRDQDGAVRHLITRLVEFRTIEAVGHRVVHGGDRFGGPALIDSEVIETLQKLEELAPLHNRPSAGGIRAARDVLGPRVPMVAVFDTTFHHSLPEGAARYAIPSELAHRHGIRRYGFHGLSYESVLSRYAEMTGIREHEATLVVLHLGSGCSAAAIKDGRSFDTSMGFTPLEGLVMGTRAGDLDPTIPGYLAQKEGVTVETVEEWLNTRSGLLGLSGLSQDMRVLLAAESDHRRARLAINVFCYRARKYIGAYLAALGGAQAIVFTGGIGENSPEIRARILEGMEWCGVQLDPTLNGAVIGVEGRISSPDAVLPVYVIPTDEEFVIARETVRCVEESKR